MKVLLVNKFHYRKALNYIFKKEPITTEIADGYLRNKKVHIVAAPGGGKTILGLEIILRLKKPVIIFLLNRN